MLEKAVRAAKGKVKLVKMNIDEHPAIPGQMGIQSIPAVIAFVNGQPADGFMGALPESQVVAFLERLTKDRIGGEAKDLLKAADAALAAGDAAGAAELYAQVLAEDSANVPALAGPGALLCARPARSSRPADARDGAGSQAQRCRGRRRARRARTRRAGQDASARSPSWNRRSPPIRSIIRRASISRSRSTARAAALDALDHLIAIVKRDRKWNDDGARKQLVQFFDAWGPTDEATIEGRKRLSSILFA